MKAISKGTKGAISELRIATNLMALGWDVYRCYSPNAGTDLVALKGRTTLRVQVKSSLNGQYENLRQGSNDLLGIVGPDNEIRYRARTKQVAKMFPSCGLARPPKHRR
jgi:hypothetical protein